MFSAGSNIASAPAVVPRVFRWKDKHSNESVLTLYHPHGYGGVDVKDMAVVPEANVALLPAWKQDNTGPHNPSEVLSIVNNLLSVLPAGTIVKAYIIYFDSVFANPH